MTGAMWLGCRLSQETPSRSLIRRGVFKWVAGSKPSAAESGRALRQDTLDALAVALLVVVLALRCRTLLLSGHLETGKSLSFVRRQ